MELDVKKMVLIVLIAAVAVTAVIAGGKLKHKSDVKQEKSRQEELQRQEEAWDALNLVWDKRTEKLTKEATDERFSDAQRKITRVEEKAVAKELKSEYKQAKEKYDEFKKDSAEAEKRARELVDTLWDNTNYVIKEGTTRQNIEDAKVAVSDVPDESVQTELSETVDKADKYLAEKEEEAQKAVITVWDENTNRLVEGATREQYQEAKEKVDGLPEGEIKSRLSVLLGYVETAFTTEEETVAKQAIQQIWNPDTEELIGEVSKEDYKNAEKLVENLHAGEVKKELKAELEKIKKAMK